MKEQNEFTTEQEYKEYITKTVIDNSESTENIVTAGTEWDITNSEKDKEKNTFLYEQEAFWKDLPKKPLRTCKTNT